jgi:hypothetical protein
MQKVSLKLARRATTLLSTLDQDQKPTISKKDKRKLKKESKKKSKDKKKQLQAVKPRTIGPNELAVLQMRTGISIKKDKEGSDDSDMSDYDDLM